MRALCLMRDHVTHEGGFLAEPTAAKVAGVGVHLRVDVLILWQRYLYVFS